MRPTSPAKATANYPSLNRLGPLRRVPLCSALLMLALNAAAASTLRCGSALISLEDTPGEVLNTCGEPRSHDLVGYKEVQDWYGRFQEIPIEEWVYGPRNGMLYFLRFEGGRLKKIDSRRGQ